MENKKKRIEAETPKSISKVIPFAPLFSHLPTPKWCDRGTKKRPRQRTSMKFWTISSSHKFTCQPQSRGYLPPRRRHKIAPCAHIFSGQCRRKRRFSTSHRHPFQDTHENLLKEQTPQVRRKTVNIFHSEGWKLGRFHLGFFFPCSSAISREC